MDGTGDAIASRYEDEEQGSNSGLAVWDRLGWYVSSDSIMVMGGYLVLPVSQRKR